MGVGKYTPFPHIEVLPNKALAGENVSIRLVDFEPGQVVTIRAHMRDDLDRRWSSHARFKADIDGMVDLASRKPLSGTYEGIDPMGLIWSMALDPEEGEISPFAKRELKPDTVIFTAEVDWQPVAFASLERLYIEPGVKATPVREHRLVGTFYQPAGPGPHPGVIVLSGSDGGMYKGVAARLASHGYAALALAYFGVEHLPPQLINIPLEYFEKAIQWIQSNPAVKRDYLAAIGWARGGELALLLGATFPAIKAVVGYVASGVITIGGVRALTDLLDMQPAWSFRGRPLPFVPVKSTPSFEEQVRANEPVALASLYLKGLEDRSALEKALIPVERIGGPVLLISGKDDQMWPSSVLSDLAMNRLSENNHPYPYKHLSYDDAGHNIGLPHRPTTVTRHRHPMGAVLDFGGTPKGNAFAAVDSWPRVLRFLKQAFST
jgi:dienelactone hydrolase